MPSTRRRRACRQAWDLVLEIYKLYAFSGFDASGTMSRRILMNTVAKLVPSYQEDPL